MRQYFTAAEAAQVLHITEHWIREHLNELPNHIMVGRTLVFSDEQIDEIADMYTISRRGQELEMPKAVGDDFSLPTAPVALKPSTGPRRRRATH